MRAASGQVHAPELAVRDLGARERGEGLAREVDIVGEARAAAQQRVVFAAQRLAAAAETQAVLGHRLSIIWRPQGGGS